MSLRSIDRPLDQPDVMYQRLRASLRGSSSISPTFLLDQSSEIPSGPMRLGE